MSRKVITIDTVRTHLQNNLKLAGLFAEENVRIFREVYNIQYYSTEIEKLHMLSILQILSGRRNSFVYENKEVIDIYLLDEVVIRINKSEESYAFMCLSEEYTTYATVDERVMDFIHDLKQQLKTLTNTALLEETIEELIGNKELDKIKNGGKK